MTVREKDVPSGNVVGLSRIPPKDEDQSRLADRVGADDKLCKTAARLAELYCDEALRTHDPAKSSFYLDNADRVSRYTLQASPSNDQGSSAEVIKKYVAGVRLIIESRGNLK